MSNRYEYTFRGKDAYGNDYMLSFASTNHIEWENAVEVETDELTWAEF